MKPMMLPCSRFAARLVVMAALALAVGQLGGCALWRRTVPLALPPDFTANPQAAALANPATRQAAYQSLFPEFKTIQASGGLVASKRWRPGKEVVDFSYYSVAEKTGATEHMMRLRGTREPVGAIFDFIVRGRYVTVVYYLPKVFFQGPLSPEGSPFGQRFGVEPWDLAPIITIGQRVASAEFDADRGERTTTLKPKGGTADGLTSVVLENRSGLPKEAEWVLSGRKYEVKYLGWGFFTDRREGGKTRLMPSEIKVSRGPLRLSLEARAYQYDKEPSDQIFRPIIDQNFRELPLEELNKQF